MVIGIIRKEYSQGFNLLDAMFNDFSISNQTEPFDLYLFTGYDTFGRLLYKKNNVF